MLRDALLRKDQAKGQKLLNIAEFLPGAWRQDHIASRSRNSLPAAHSTSQLATAMIIWEPWDLLCGFRLAQGTGLISIHSDPPAEAVLK